MILIEITKKYRRYFYGSIAAIIGGFLLTFAGFVIYLWGEPRVGEHIYNNLPIVHDGSIVWITGILLSSVGIYRLLVRKNVFKQISEQEKEKYAEAKAVRKKSGSRAQKKKKIRKDRKN